MSGRPPQLPAFAQAAWTQIQRDFFSQPYQRDREAAFDASHRKRQREDAAEDAARAPFDKKQKNEEATDDLFDELL